MSSSGPAAAPVATGAHQLERGMTLPHAVALLLGFVIGASIFLLVGPLMGLAGPGLFVSYALAAVPAVFVCLYNIQLGAVLPTTGANYVASTRFISPFAGFMTTWMVLVGALFGVPLLAWGFASYLAELAPETPQLTTAVVVVVVLGLVNIVGIRPASWLQLAMVAVFVLALALFVLGGLPNIDASRYTPLFPNGTSAMFLAAVAAYYSYAGFTVITEVAGEIKRPRRNVSLTLIISFAVVLLVYVGVTSVLGGTMSWQVASESPAAVSESAATFLPPGAVVFISIGGLFASATTINAVFATISRDVMRLGRDEVFPAAFGRVHAKFKSPHVAIALLMVISALGVLLAFAIEKYALLTVFSFLVIHLITATAVLLLPRKRPDLWARSPVKFTPFWRWFVYIGVVTLAGLFIVFGVVSEPASGVLFVVIAAVGVPHWFSRKRQLARRGLDLDQSMRQFTHDIEEELTTA